MAIWASSCKLDPVVLPPGTIIGPNNGQTVLGTTINGRNINNSYLTGDWHVQLTVEQYYDTTDVVIHGNVGPNRFNAVSFKELGKKVNFIGFASSGTYQLSLNYNVLLVKLPDDPFGRSKNTPVRITALTATNMSWLAIDSTRTMYNGKVVNRAYKIDFAK